MIVLAAFTVATSSMRVLPVSRSIAPWTFRRCRPLACATAIGTSLGAQQPIVCRDEAGLLVRVELAGNRLRLAMLHAKPVQQRDQARPALVGDAALRLDPGANFTRRPRQRLGDPGFQPVLLRLAQAARAAFVAEARQTL